MTKLCIYIIFIGICFSEVIDGYVYDENQKPIYNAEIYIKQTDNKNMNFSLNAITDIEGYFKIASSNLFSNDNYIILVSHIGYDSKEIIVSILDNLVITLRRKIMDTEQVTVTALGYNTYIKDTPIITQVITKNDILQSSYTTIQDAIQFAIPNIQKVHDIHGNDRVKIQGLDNKFVVFMVDGKRMQGEFAGNFDFSMISLSDVEKIEFIKSGMSTLYGSDAMGGIVNIITQKNQEPKISISYSYDLPTIQSMGLNLGLNYKNFIYKLHFDYNDSPGYDLTDYSIAKTYEEQIHGKIMSSIEYKNEFLSFNYTNKYYRKSIKKYIQNADGSLDVDARNPRYFDYFNSINFSYMFNKDLNFELELANDLYNKSIYFTNYYNNKGATITTAHPQRVDFKSAIQYNMKGHSLYFGFEYDKEIYQAFNVSNPLYDDFVADPDSCLNYITEQVYPIDEISLCDQDNEEIFNNNSEDNAPNEYIMESIFGDENKREIDEYSLFLSDKFLFKSFEFVLGNRFTKYSTYNWRTIPSLSIRMENGLYNYRFNYAKGYRIPSLKEMYYSFEEHSPQIYGNPDLRPSLSDYYSISIESRKLANSYFELFVNEVENMISYISMDDGLYYANGDRIRLYGLNTAFEKSFFQKFKLQLTYSFTEGESNSIELLEGISNHALNIKFNYHFYNNMHLILSSKYTSSKYVILFESGLKRELEGHMISDLIITDRRGKINFKLGIKNLFNYLDASRLDSGSAEHLTSTDPGRRVYFNIGFSL